ncbi:MAG: acyl-CoA dehydrogenase family protein, partial [Acidimicrobiia bacterium]
VRVPAENLLGEEGGAFAVAQTRLGGGRVHHAMRTVGLAQRALDMMCERALSRQTKGSLLAEKQAVQHMIADSYAQLLQFRLIVLYTAWQIDKYQNYLKVRKDIATIKVLTPTVLEDIARRAIQIHGALGMTNELPLGGMMVGGMALALADGPTEVHKDTVARQLLRQYKPAEGLWPSAYLPPKREAAREKLARLIDLEAAEL